MNAIITKTVFAPKEIGVDLHTVCEEDWLVGARAAATAIDEYCDKRRMVHGSVEYENVTDVMGCSEHGVQCREIFAITTVFKVSKKHWKDEWVKSELRKVLMAPKNDAIRIPTL